MGCFETIYFKCPACGAELSAQSKSGPCEMNVYEHTAVPIDVAMDANRHAPYKCACGKSWVFRVPELTLIVSLPIEEAT